MAHTLEIVCPVRNGGDAFRETLRSLAPLARPGCTLLISDNFSTDGNLWADLLPELTAWQPRIIRPPAELGRVEHWTWALRQSTAQLVKPMMSGDFLAPTCVERVLAAADAHPEASFSFCQSRMLEVEKEYVAGPLIPEGLISSERFRELTVEQGNVAGALTGVTFRRDILFSALPFDTAFPWSADWRLYCRCAAVAPCYFIAEPLCLLNRRIARFSSSPRFVLLSLREEWGFLREFGASFSQRLKLVGFQGVAKLGRVVLPARIRKPLGALYRLLKR